MAKKIDLSGSGKATPFGLTNSYCSLRDRGVNRPLSDSDLADGRKVCGPDLPPRLLRHLPERMRDLA